MATKYETVADIIAERDALRKDAERYRWLRDVASGGDWEHIGQNTDPTSTDARIDECMAAYKAVGASANVGTAKAPQPMMSADGGRDIPL